MILANFDLRAIGNQRKNHEKWDGSALTGIVDHHDLLSGLPSLQFSTVFLQEHFSVLY
jgi:hypothetical protein